MRHIGGQSHCALFNEVRILASRRVHVNLIADQNGERGTVAVCDVLAWGQYRSRRKLKLGFCVVIGRRCKVQRELKENEREGCALFTLCESQSAENHDTLPTSV